MDEERHANIFRGTKLTELRKQRNINQTTLAQKLNSNKSSISKLETGKTRPTPTIEHNICTFFGVEKDYFRK